MLAITIGGPAQSFHFFRPTYATSLKSADRVVPGYNVADPAHTPRIVPDGKPHQWTMTYDPAGNGKLTVTLDGESSMLELQPGVKDTPGVTFDRFGLFTMRPDGNSNDIYFDDLSYTASHASSAGEGVRE